LEGGVAGDFVVDEGGKNKEKGGERRCRLEELGLAGEVVGAEVLAGGLVEVGVEAGLALGGEWDMGIHMLAGTEEPLLIWDMAIPTMAGATLRPTDTLMDTHHAELINLKE
jgi:hypothetical protein